ncbi:MAG: helical backbone metal receptor [Bacteroidales bacterium]
MTMNPKTIFGCLLILFVITGGMVMAGHDAGEKPRIVSLSPSITKMVHLLGGHDQLVGYTSFCKQEDDEDTPVVASQMNVNIEKILDINPDFVVTTKLTAARDIEMLRKTGVSVRVMDTPTSFDDLCGQMITLGNITGRKDTARIIVNREKERLYEVQQNIPEDDQLSMFMQLGARPLFAAIPGTFMDDYIQLAGGVNTVGDLRQGAINREMVLSRDPDVIFIVMGGSAGQYEKENWLNYDGLQAAASRKVFVLDEDKAASPTPVTFVDIVEDMITHAYHH